MDLEKSAQSCPLFSYVLSEVNVSVNKKELHIFELAEPVVESLDYSLIEVEYKKEGKDWFLRFYLDKPGGITLDDCVRGSEVLAEKLDEWDIIDGHYFLDVSSPGAERPIKTEKDLETTLNNGIYVKTYQHIDGEQEWTGILTEYDDSSVTIKYRDKTREKTVTVDRDKIAVIRKAVLV